MTREEAARLSFDELEAAGFCECGAPLEGHPPLGRPGPLSERGERTPEFGLASAGSGSTRPSRARASR